MTAKVDYAVRAMAEMASASAASPLKAETVAWRQDIPVRFLLNILASLRVARLVDSRRGSDGGYWLARPSEKISVADVIRAVEGPLADVHGAPPEDVTYPPSTAGLRDVWLATRAALRRVLETVTIADVVAGDMPAEVTAELTQPGALERR
ncbi:MAG: RrF2 family transcriptional regulator [Streptosporangiaceae bacterium]